MNSPIPAFSHHIIKHSKPSCAQPGLLLYLHTWVLCYLYFHETQYPIHKPNVFVPLPIPLDNLVPPGSTYLLQDPFSFQDTHANKIYFLTFFSTHLKTGDFFKIELYLFLCYPPFLPSHSTPSCDSPLPISSDLLLAFLAKIMCSIYSYQFKTGDFLSSKVNLCLLSGLLISNLFLFYSSSPLRSFFFVFQCHIPCQFVYNNLHWFSTFI